MLECNATAVTLGPLGYGEGDTENLLTVYGSGHADAAATWAAQYNELVKTEQILNQRSDDWYRDNCAYTTDARTAPADEMPPVVR